MTLTLFSSIAEGVFDSVGLSTGVVDSVETSEEDVVDILVGVRVAVDGVV